MKKKVFGIITVVIGIALMQRCTYDKGLLVPLVTCPDTLNVSFAAKVRPLLQANCFSCHGNGSSLGNVSLDTYDQVMQLATSGRLLGSISHSPGFSPMPLNADKLNNCSITAVGVWIEEGMQNN